MTDRDEPIDVIPAGEPDPARGRELATRRDQVPAARQQTAVANPLDLNPETFAQALQQRQRNYAVLREYLGSTLVPGKDFGRIHIDKSCDLGPYRCKRDEFPWHWSEFTLFAPGADKILGLLGLAPTYPSEQDLRRQILRGVDLKHVIMTCHIVDGHGRVMAEGTGSASLDEHRGAALHNTIAKAQKRARLEACRRLPAVSAIFEDPAFISASDLATLNQQRQRAEQRRAQQDPVTPPQRNRYATGKDLERMPFGKYKGRPLRELGDDYLEWCTGLDDKPDVAEAARRELDRRRLQEPASSSSGSRGGADDVRLPPDDDGFLDDGDGPPPDAYFR